MREADIYRSEATDFDPDSPWLTVRSRILPLLPTRSRPSQQRPLESRLPSGVVIRFGVDLGHGILEAAHSKLRDWRIEASEVEAAAIGNLRSLVENAPQSSVRRAVIGDDDVLVLVGESVWPSVSFLVPDLLVKLTGEDSGLFNAPSRSVAMVWAVDAPTANIVRTCRLVQRALGDDVSAPFVRFRVL